jgi:hypothetical protein
MVVELTIPGRAHSQLHANEGLCATRTGTKECWSCHCPPCASPMRMNSGFSVGIVGMAPWLADLRLHLDCCVASLWPASPALLLFFLLMVVTVHL